MKGGDAQHDASICWIVKPGDSRTIDVQFGSFLKVTGLTSGTLVLASGQTLEGKGTVTGKTTADTGSHVSPGESPGILHTGDVTFNSGSNFDVESNGPTVGTDYDQLNVTGLVTLTDATLNLSGSYVPLTGETFTIIDNDDSVDAVIGTFAGLAEGAGIASFLGSSLNAQISYQGGDGNDVILTVPEVTVSASPSSVAENSGTGLVYTPSLAVAQQPPR